MLNVSIDPQLKNAAPDLVLGVVKATVNVTKHNDRLWKEIDGRISQIMGRMNLEGVSRLPEISALRDAYHALGKDPSRYRGSQEALFRRILQGKGLYRINTVVDINNLVSLETAHSVGSYNLARLGSNVSFRVGNAGETYKGIGKETINIEGLPVFSDEHGPFGSPTSDSERAMITLDTKEVAMVIITFSGPQHLKEYLQRTANLLCEYTDANQKTIETLLVE